MTRRALLRAAAATGGAALLPSCALGRRGRPAGRRQIIRAVTGSLISIIPLVAAFLMLQRYWQSGLTAGGVKE
jgi:ABC-type glycerol-3-phosphate transport system permease component